jgi:protein-S-isoprenylcysteine O-methyltransferase Ste14
MLVPRKNGGFVRATTWEFRNRGMVFGLIFGAAFFFYLIDHQNATVWLANFLAAKSGRDATNIARAILALGALLVALCSLMRTWASSYLHDDIVYASDVKTAALVADGPYRRVRNPLYFGNVLLALGIGATASRTGFVFLVLAMIVFCYRLIFREESELSAAQHESYAAYLRAVPRLLPSLVPKIPPAGARAKWAAGFRAEAWCWAFAAGMVAFAITLSQVVFFAVIAMALAAAWLLNRLASKPASG